MQKFHLYDIGTMDPSVLDALRGLLSEGIVEISNVKNLTKYKSWETGTLLPINDCLFRAYKKSRWIVYVDPLSFLHVQKGPSSMSEFMLQKFEQSVYTLGNHEFASWICEKTVTHHFFDIFLSVCFTLGFFAFNFSFGFLDFTG